MDVRCGNRGSLPGRIGTTNAVKVQAREERKEKGGGTVRTWTTRARRTTNVRNRPTNYYNFTIKLYLAQPTAVCLAITMPWYSSTKWACEVLHNDNVVLTQGCCYRCNATTATPATASKFYEKTSTACWTRAKNVRGSSPRSLALLCQYV